MTNDRKLPRLPRLPRPYTTLGRFVDRCQQIDVFTRDQLLAYGRACAGARGECIWSEEDPWGPMAGTYETACGKTWSFIDGGAVENGVRFCHSCGKPVKIKAFRREDVQGDENE
jgi:hypothetical protein